jgi:hypothetical protein
MTEEFDIKCKLDVQIKIIYQQIITRIRACQKIYLIKDKYHEGMIYIKISVDCSSTIVQIAWLVVANCQNLCIASMSSILSNLRWNKYLLDHS